MQEVAKPGEPKTVESVKKIYIPPRLVTHGDVAELTNDHHHKPHHQGDGPESELS
jgi:hypothetical protein